MELTPEQLEERNDRKELIEKELNFIGKNKVIRFNAIKNKIGIQDLTTPVISVFFYSKYTDTFGGSNIKRNRKRNKTIKRNKKNKKGKKSKRSKVTLR